MKCFGHTLSFVRIRDRAILILFAITLTACGGGGSSISGSDDPGGGGDGGDDNGNTTVVSLEACSGGDSAITSVGGGGTSDGSNTITLWNTTDAAKSNFQVTFGQVFAPGAIGDSQTLAADSETATAVPLQVDRKATHGDGSLRHAVLSAHITESIPAGGSLRLDLSSTTGASSASGTSPSLPELLDAGFDTLVELTVDGTTYTASAADLLANGTPSLWLDGPIVREWLVSGAFTDADNNEHPHLHARFHVRAYSANKVRVAVVVENNWTFVADPEPGDIVYDAQVTVNGTDLVLQAEDLRHFISARWRRVFWTGADTAEFWPEGLRCGIHIAHDGEYIQNIGAVPEYKDGLVVPEGTLDFHFDNYINGVGRESNGTSLMEIGSLNGFMPQTGFQAPIGILPSSTARYLLSQDERAKRIAIGNAEQAGTWSIHYRDQRTDLPVSIDDEPDLHTQRWVCCPNPAGPQGRATFSQDRSFDVAHHPDPNFLAYLVTGDYYLLEESQFWATFILLETKPDEFGRGFEAGVIQVNQQRGQAWSLRTIAHAEYLTPDDHAMKAYWTDKLEHNRDWYAATYADMMGTEHEATIPALDTTWDNDLGWIGRGAINRDPNLMSPWMDDYMTAVVGQIVKGFGYADPAWQAFYDFKSSFVVARMTDPATSAVGWCYENPTAPKLVISADEGDTGDTVITDGLFTTMLEIYQATPAYPEGITNSADWTGDPVDDCADGGGMSNGPDSTTSLVAFMTPAIATAADNDNVPGAGEAYQRFCGRDAQPTDAAWAAEPVWAIVPRTVLCEP